MQDPTSSHSSDDKSDVHAAANDAARSALSSAERLLIARHWQGRARSESIAAVRFASLLNDVARLGTSPGVLELLAFAVGEEWRHTRACAELAAFYAGREVRLPTEADDRSPTYPDRPNEISVALRLLGTSCISEMVAATWLQECLEGTTVPCVRARLRELLKDDVRHARIGWAHLATRTLSGLDNQRDLGPGLAEVFDKYATPWLYAEDFPDEGFPTHGLPSLKTTREVTFSTVRDLILPGLEEVGIAPEPALAWLRDAEVRYPVGAR